MQDNCHPLQFDHDFTSFLIESLHIPIVLLTAEADSFYASKAFTENVCALPEGSTQLDFFEIFTEPDRRKIKNLLAAPGQTFNEEVAVSCRISSAEGERNYSVGFMQYKGAAGRTTQILTFKPMQDTQSYLQQLAEDSSRYKALVSQAADALFIHDFQGRLVEVNQQACESLGYTREELLNMSILDIEHDFSLESAQFEWMQIQRKRRHFLKGHQKRKDGTLFPVEVSFGCTEWMGEVYYLGLVRDISDKVEAEYKFQTIVESAPDPIFIRTGVVFSYLNPSACKLFGISAQEELLGKPVMDMIYSDDRKTVIERIRRQNIEIETTDDLFEQRFLRKDGTMGWVETKAKPIIYEGAESALVFMRDITGRKVAAEQLKDYAERYHSSFEYSAVGMCMTGLDGTLIHVNQKMCNMFESEKNELEGKTIAEITYVEDHEISTKAVDEMIQTHGKSVSFEKRYVKKSGKPFWCAVNSTTVPGSDGKPLYLITQIIDISERREFDKKLFEAHEKYQKIFEYSAMGMCLTTIRGTMLSVNNKMCEMFGTSKQEIEDRDFAVFTYPDDIQLTKRKIDSLVNGDFNAVFYEKRFVKKNGDVFWASVTTTLIRSVENNPMYLATQVLDVTERRAMEEELREKEAFSRAVMDNLPIGIAVNTAPAVSFNYMNDNFPLFYRTTREALINPDSFWSAAYEDPQYRRKIRKRVLDDVATGDKSRMHWDEIPITRQGDETRYVTAYNTPVPDQDLFISVVIDETDKVQALEAVKKNAARLEALHDYDQAILSGFESFTKIGENAINYIFGLLKPERAGIGILNLEGSKLHVVSGELIQQKLYISVHDVPVSEDDIEALTNQYFGYEWLAFKQQPPPIFKGIFHCQDKCSCLNLPIRTSEQLLGFLTCSKGQTNTLSNDETETLRELATQTSLAVAQTRLRKIAERYADSLEQMVKDRTHQLEAANRELESFSYSVSHDLRAPLRSVSGFIKILQEEYGKNLDDEGKRICGIIAASAHQLGTLIDDLLSLSRIGRSSMKPESVDMSSIVQELYADLTTQTQKNSIRFAIGPLPPARADKTLIRHVWLNLLDNALKFTSKNSLVAIEIAGVENGSEVIYSVRDNGAGFNMEYSGKLFGVFQRLHSSKDFEGTGVGLAIVQRIVQRHGGKVWAEGEVNKGATFYFSLRKDDEYAET